MTLPVSDRTPSRYMPKQPPPGADFIGDKVPQKPSIAAPYKHSVLALRLEAESIRRKAALSAFYADRRTPAARRG